MFFIRKEIPMGVKIYATIRITAHLSRYVKMKKEVKMATIVLHKKLDNREVAKQIKNWFDKRNFQTKAIEQDGAYAIKARKSSGLRSFVGADRAIEVSICTLNEETHVEVRQGSWKTNVISNAAWLVVTGGMNLAFSGWSIVIQKELENYIRQVLDDMGGAKEVEL